MASVRKMFHNFKSSQLHGGRGGSAGEKRTPPPPPTPIAETTPVEDDSDNVPSDLLNRRKVSISKSGRYKENHKKRSALLNDSSKENSEARSRVMTTADSSSSVSSPSKDGQRMMIPVKDKSGALMEEKNKENEKNRENIIVRRDSIISDVDGHAVADEIESLAKTLTIEQQAIETAL